MGQSGGAFKAGTRTGQYFSRPTWVEQHIPEDPGNGDHSHPTCSCCFGLFDELSIASQSGVTPRVFGPG